MNDLQSLTALATELLTERNEVELLEQKLKDTKERIRVLEEERIPTAMDDAGMADFTTAEGFRLSVADKVRCGDLKREDGLAWLRAHGHEGLIRSEVVVPFSKGQDTVAKELLMELAGRKLAAKCESKVAWNSLASTIRTMMEQGEDVPLEILGAHIQRTVKITEK